MPSQTLETICGSSPRGRGKPSPGVRRGVRAGLIPAWAGKTPDLEVNFLLGGAHPRVGGENDQLVSLFRVLNGSSPRGRGKPL